MDRKHPDKREQPPTQDKGPETTSEKELDEALDDSFPASDPPAPVSQGTTSNPNPVEREEREEEREEREKREETENKRN
jgi:hypothetical protein